MKGRSPEELADGILERIPDDAPEKTVLRTRFGEILAGSRGTRTRYAAPERQDWAAFTDICAACEKVLGEPGESVWKQKVLSYVNRGE